MNKSPLSLRQRKLLHFLKGQTDYVTGNHIAKQLKVTSRTIRNDVKEINAYLSQWNTSILSKQGSGYILDSNHLHVLQEHNLASPSFLFREDRIRHILFELCISEHPIDLYDLEEQLYVSRTTLEHDLNRLRQTYILTEPYILLERSKNQISLEKDERKRRQLLIRLFSEHWNYSARGDAFYDYNYIDEHIVNLIIDETDFFIQKYNLEIEDYNLVYLNLALAIMVYRVKSGHQLHTSVDCSMVDEQTTFIGNALIDSIEVKVDILFPIAERNDILLHLFDSQINIDQTFMQNEFILLSERYMSEIKNIYNLDFTPFSDFKYTLIQYLYHLSRPSYYFNDMYIDTTNYGSDISISLEIAYLIQPLAECFYSRYLNKKELLYLAYCISGGLALLRQHCPPVNAVILCQYNATCSWHLKHKIINQIGSSIEITGLYPVHAKNIIDFSTIDLILSTANKSITSDSSPKTLYISPILDAKDLHNIRSYLNHENLNYFIQDSYQRYQQLLATAHWKTNQTYDSFFSLIEAMATRLLEQGIVDESYIHNILRRESILSFVCQPAVVFVFSNIPATKSTLSIYTLEHRIKRNSQQLRVVIMATITQDEQALLLSLIHLLSHESLDLDAIMPLKEKEEIEAYLLQ